MFCVNLPINTNLFYNNSIITITKACNKASETVKSTLVSKYENFDSTALEKIKSFFDSSEITSTCTTANSSTININTVTSPVINKFLDANKREMVEDWINILPINMKKTELLVENKAQDAVQLLSTSLVEQPEQQYKYSTVEIDNEVSEVTSFEETSRYESDEDSIFEPPSTPFLSYIQACKNTIVIYPRIKTKITLAPIYEEPIVAEFMELVDEMYEKSIVTKPTIEEPIVAQFIGMVEAKAREPMGIITIDYTSSYVLEFFRLVENDQHLKMVSIYDTSYISGFFNMVEKDHYSTKEPILDSTSYTSDFFKMIEKDQESKELKITKQEVTMDFIWLQIYKILSNKSCNQRLQLFELSQLETKKKNTREITPQGPKNLKRKKDIPKYAFKNLVRKPGILHVL